MSAKMNSSGAFDMVSRQDLLKQPLRGLRPAVHDMIGHRLRQHYEEQQPLPGRLAELMRQLDDKPEEPAGPRQY